MHEVTTREDLIGVVMNTEPMLLHPPAWVVNRMGTPKAQLFDALRRQSQQRGMIFPVVFMDACRSELSRAEQSALRGAAIGHVFATRGDNPYRTLAYREVLRSATTSLPDALDSALAARARERMAETAGAPQVSRYLVPLVAWFGAAAFAGVWRWYGARQAATHERSA